MAEYHMDQKICIKIPSYFHGFDASMIQKNLRAHLQGCKLYHLVHLKEIQKHDIEMLDSLYKLLFRILKTKQNWNNSKRYCASENRRICRNFDS